MKRFLISMALAAMLTASVAGGVSANEDEREHALFGRCAALLAQNLEPAR